MKISINSINEQVLPLLRKYSIIQLVPIDTYIKRIQLKENNGRDFLTCEKKTHNELMI